MKQLRVPTILTPAGSTVVVAGDGKILDLQWLAVLNFEIAEQTLYHEVGVVKDLPLEFLIGGELMKSHDCTLTYSSMGRNILTLGKETCSCCKFNSNRLENANSSLIPLTLKGKPSIFVGTTEKLLVQDARDVVASIENFDFNWRTPVPLKSSFEMTPRLCPEINSCKKSTDFDANLNPCLSSNRNPYSHEEFPFYDFDLWNQRVDLNSGTSCLRDGNDLAICVSNACEFSLTLLWPSAMKTLASTNENDFSNTAFHCDYRKMGKSNPISIFYSISNPETQPVLSLAHVPSFHCKSISFQSFQSNAFLPNFLSPSISRVPPNPGDGLCSVAPETLSAFQSPQYKFMMEFLQSLIANNGQIMETYETSCLMNFIPQQIIELNLLSRLLPALDILFVANGNLPSLCIIDSRKETFVLLLLPKIGEKPLIPVPISIAPFWPHLPSIENLSHANVTKHLAIYMIQINDSNDRLIMIILKPLMKHLKIYDYELEIPLEMEAQFENVSY